MLYGLMAAWLIVVAYAVHLTLRGNRLRKELDRVKRMVESGEKRP
jgi:CcmD family protein